MSKKIASNYAFDQLDFNNDETYEVATAKGIGLKTILLVGITILSVFFSVKFIPASSPVSFILYIGIIIANFVCQIVIYRNVNLAKKLSIVYAILEGLLLGIIIGTLAHFLGNTGFVISGLALVATIAIFFAASILYTTGVIKAGNKLRSFMFVFLIGSIFVSLFVALFSLIFRSAFLEFYNSFGLTLMLIVSIIMVLSASIYVVISLDNAAIIVSNEADKKYEWLAAYGILINIIWLYIEVLRLLMILFSKSND